MSATKLTLQEARDAAAARHQDEENRRTYLDALRRASQASEAMQRAHATMRKLGEAVIAREIERLQGDHTLSILILGDAPRNAVPRRIAGICSCGFARRRLANHHAEFATSPGAVQGDPQSYVGLVIEAWDRHMRETAQKSLWEA